jgi:hypothetical protein
MEEIEAFYPELVNVTELLDTRELNIGTRQAGRTMTVKLAAGSLSALAYYSLTGGCTQVESAFDACRGQTGDGVKCALRASAASVAHILTFGAGFVGGRQFIMYFWHRGALQAAGLPAGQTKHKRACNTNQRQYSSSTHFSGTHSLQIAGKDMHCFSPDSGEIAYAQALGSMITDKMDNGGTCATTVQFTIFTTSSRQVLGRFHQALNLPRNVCPFAITGGDACSA